MVDVEVPGGANGGGANVPRMWQDRGGREGDCEAGEQQPSRRGGDPTRACLGSRYWRVAWSFSPKKLFRGASIAYSVLFRFVYALSTCSMPGTLASAQFEGAGEGRLSVRRRHSDASRALTRALCPATHRSCQEAPAAQSLPGCA